MIDSLHRFSCFVRQTYIRKPKEKDMATISFMRYLFIVQGSLSTEIDEAHFLKLQFHSLKSPVYRSALENLVECLREKVGDCLPRISVKIGHPSWI